MLVVYNNELYHHGVKGQKWGVRRYRNEDGTLTPLGKRRSWNKTADEPESAKSYAKRLNKYDKQRSKYEYNTYKAMSAHDEYDKRMRKALEKGRLDKAEKNMAKRDKELAKHKERVEFNQQQVKAIKKETNRLLKNAEKKGYTIKSKHVIRRIRDGEDHVLNLMAFGLGAATLYATPLTFMIIPQTGGYVPGTKYKVAKE